MIVASHQIDLLPFPGFFNRMLMADIFDLGGHYDWWRKGKGIYQHRVKIGFDDKPVWLTLPVIAREGMTQDQVKLKQNEVPALFDKIRGVYAPCPNFRKYAPILERKFANPPEYLWQFNMDLLLWLRDTLEIRTPIAISHSTLHNVTWTATEKITSQLVTYKRDGEPLFYYSGSGGVNYLDREYMRVKGIEVMFQDYSKAPIPEGFRTVSLLSLLMCKEPSEIYRMLNRMYT